MQVDKEAGFMVCSCIKDVGLANHSKKRLQAVQISEERKLQWTFSAHSINISPQMTGFAIHLSLGWGRLWHFPMSLWFWNSWHGYAQSTMSTIHICSELHTPMDGFLPNLKLLFKGGTLFPCSVTSSSRLGSIWAILMNKNKSLAFTQTPVWETSFTTEEATQLLCLVVVGPYTRELCVCSWLEVRLGSPLV